MRDKHPKSKPIFSPKSAWNFYIIKGWVDYASPSTFTCVTTRYQKHKIPMLSLVMKHFKKVKQTKSVQKEVISGNMSHTLERIKITKVLFTTKKLPWIDICFARKDLKALDFLCLFLLLFSWIHKVCILMRKGYCNKP